MGAFKEIASLISLIHYNTPEIKDNWRVEFGGLYIGDMHDCDGIGGQIGNFTETGLFDYVCALAKEDLESHYPKPPHDAAPNRAADFITRETAGEHVRMYWFKEMVVWNAYNNRMTPLKYDDEGDILDFFDFDQGFWIDLGEEVLKEYRLLLGEEVINDMLKSDKDKVEEAISLLSTIEGEGSHSDRLSEILDRLENYCMILE